MESVSFFFSLFLSFRQQTTATMTNTTTTRAKVTPSIMRMSVVLFKKHKFRHYLLNEGTKEFSES